MGENLMSLMNRTGGGYSKFGAGTTMIAGVPYPVVDYITNNTITSYFDTGIQATINMEARCKFEIGTWDYVYYKALFGTGWGGDGSQVMSLRGWAGSGGDGRGIQVGNGWGTKNYNTVSFDTGTTIEYYASIASNGKVTQTLNGETETTGYAILSISRPNIRVLQVGSNSYTADTNTICTKCYPFYIKTETDEMNAVCVNVNGAGAYYDTIGKRLLLPTAGSFSIPT